MSDFEARLRASHTQVELVADWMRRGGIQVRIPEQRPGADGGDLFAGSKRIEVKGTTVLDFNGTKELAGFRPRSRCDCTCGGNHWDMLICSCASLEATIKRRDPMPYAYIVVNASGTQLAVFNVAATLPHWREVEQRDNSRGQNYFCFVSCVLRAQFFPISFTTSEYKNWLEQYGDEK